LFKKIHPSLLSFLILSGVCIHHAIAQTYPTRSIRLVVPYTPGQGADSAARIVATKLSERLQQAIVIDNKPGAAGNIGSEIVARAPSDGYTLLMGSNATHAANSSLFKSLRFDPQNDFSAVAYIGSVSMVMLASPSFAATNIEDLLKLAKNRPGDLTVAVPSTTARVALELLTTNTGAKFKEVPYKGSSAAMTDLMGGHVLLSIDTAVAATPLVSNGKLKALGVTTLNRTAVLPDIKTFSETGLIGYNIAAWNVWVAPRGTPKEIIDLLNKEIRTVLNDPDVKSKLIALGYEPDTTMSPNSVSEFLRNETKKWGELIRSAGIKED